MFIATDRFGSIDLTDRKVFQFPQGLPGFEELRQFILIERDESKPILWLQSIENGHICLPVIIPFEFMDDYFIEIRDYELEDLQIADMADLILMNVVVIPEDISHMTANLAAPIIMNGSIGLAKQIIVDAKEMPIRFPIYDMIMQKLRGGDADAGALTQEG